MAPPRDIAALKAWAQANPIEARDALDKARAMRAALAREDINEFVEFVMRDEKTNEPITQAAHHEEFQRLATEHARLIVWGHVESGKTLQLAIARVLWELGRNPNLRIVVVSATLDQSVKLVRAIQAYIEHSPELREVFPNLLPGPIWTSQKLTVKRTSRAKDPSLVASPVTGRILGARVDLLILDDVVTWTIANSPAQRRDLSTWLHGTATGRLTDGARVWVLGNAFHPEDLLHELEKNPVWHARRFPVIDAVTGKSMWPDVWPDRRIEERRRELAGQPDEFARQMLCIARDDQAARFKREWLDHALRRGEGKKFAYAMAAIPAGYAIYTGVDLGVRAKKGADLTVLTTIIVHPNQDREVLCIESGNWNARVIVDRIVDTHKRFGGIVIVENNAAQQFIVDITKDESAVPVKPFHTGSNKAHPEFGIESLATEFANGKWILPAKSGRPAHPEIAKLCGGMLFYDPKAHTADHLMSLWFAREGSRLPGKKQARVARVDLMSR